MRLGRKTKRLVHTSALATVAGVAMVPLTASATTYYWDTNGATTGIGHFPANSTFSWLTNNWSTTSFGDIATGAWTNTSPNADQAYFAGSAGTVVVSGSVNVNSIDFRTAGYTLSASGANYLTLSGSSPTINVSPPGSGTAIVAISAPLAGANGLTLSGNSDQGNGLKFLQLQNSSGANPNTFTGPFVISAGGALRLGGGSLNEQIGDNTDMTVYGVLDFITSGGASDGKQEKVRDVSVANAANFSVGNGANFVVNSISASNTTGPAIALNGNTATNAARLTINGWANGNATLTLNDGSIKMNTTSAGGGSPTLTAGSAVYLAGDINASGNSFIYNQNGGGAGTATTNTFTWQDINFTAAASTINIAAGGTLTITSAASLHPIILNSSAGSVTLIKTGAGTFVMNNAVENTATFAGTNEVREGAWVLGASERLGNSSTLLVSGGSLLMNSVTETVGRVTLSSGTIAGIFGAAGSTLISTSSFDVRGGYVDLTLGGATASLVKSTSGTVTVKGPQTYGGSTTVNAGTLSFERNISSPTLTINAGAARFEPWNTPNDARGTNRFESLTIAPAAKLDLTNNSLILDSSAPGILADQVRQYLASGAIVGTITPDNAIGYGDNQVLQFNTYASRDVSTHNNVILKWTYLGDATLDGRVDISDLYQIATHWQSSGQWTGGDFNYDGFIDAADLGILSQRWQFGVSSPIPAESLSTALMSLGLPQVSIPEPCISIIAAGAVCLMRRRRSSTQSCSEVSL